MTENQEKRVLSREWMVIIFTIILAAGLAIAFDFYYDLNDDTAIKDIIAGTYTGAPSGYSIQMLYPLSYVISLFYRAIPGLPWYGLFLYACQFGAAALIAFRLTKLVTKQWMQIAVLLFEALLFVGLLIRQLVIVQYSVTSGICMATAIFLYITGEEVESRRQYLKQNLMPIFFVILSFMIRTEVCTMLLPFLLLAGFGKWMAQEEPFSSDNIVRYLMLIGIAIFGMGMMYAIDVNAYEQAENSEEWEEFWTFFDARTDLYDFYGIPSYSDNYHFFEQIGLKRESYTLLENYNYSLDESIDAEMLEQLVEFQKRYAGTEYGLEKTAGFISKKSLKDALWLYKNDVFHNGSGVYGYVILAAYVSYMLLAIRGNKRGFHWKITLLLLIRSILWIYLFMVDRYIERVTCPLMIAEICVLFGWIVEETQNSVKNAKNKFLKIIELTGIYGLLSICGVLAFGTNAKNAKIEYDNRECVNSRWEALIEYCKQHENYYYLVDVYSSTSYDGIAYSEKMFEKVDNSYRNFDICGGWVSKSPLMYEKLEEMQIYDLESALISSQVRTPVYFIAKPDADMHWMTQYYASKGIAVTVRNVDTIFDVDKECFYVYQIRKAE